MFEASEAPGQWRNFDTVDSRILEVASVRGHVKVLLQFGRREVNLKERTMLPVYWADKSLKVMRARWFWQKNQEYFPYAEVEQERLEQLFVSNVFEKPLNLTDNLHYVINRRPDPESAELSGVAALSGMLQYRHDGKVFPRQLIRYHPSVILAREKREEKRLLEATPGEVAPDSAPAPSEPHRKEPGHLVFIVHGIGESQWKADGYASFEQRVAQLRQVT
jgi:hypothetical protein